MSFDLTDLRLFVHVVESGSITKGAELSHLALASASARIRGMEDVLEVPLLSRGRRGVTPTQAGQTLNRHARIVLTHWENMLGEMGEYAKGLKGHIRLLCNTASLSEFLPELLSAYLAQHPNVSIDMHEELSTEIVQDVVDGKADVGVMAAGADLGELEIFPFRTLTFVLAVPPDHPLADREEVSFSEALEHELVGLAEDSPFQRYLEGHAARLGREMKCRVLLRGFLAVGGMVADGVGAAVMPDTAAARCRQTMDIRVLRLTDSWATREVFLCVRSYDELPVHVRELVDMLRS
ncbi:MAG: LysR family transcriptional regulator [Desulfovibrionaceae bacterium CG1_02_65_16]|nr:MAG: LysR family transcriptional regulator [Desulfovibrionaceae bacterium CG1_02_65_16]